MKYNINNYNEIIKAFDLSTYWESKLKCKTYKENERTLRVLDELGAIVQGTALSHKLHAENKNVRKHAKSIFMNLSSPNSFKFLENDFDRDLNALDKMRIHKSLVNKAVEKPLPLLMRWVNIANNERYKAYLIREIAFFEQTASASQLIELYQTTTSVLVKNSIIKTIGELSYTEAIPVFISDFDYVNLAKQNSIIDTLGKLGGSQSLSFLAELYAKTSSKERLVKLLQHIYQLDEVGTIYLKIKETAKTEFEQKAVAYIEWSKL